MVFAVGMICISATANNGAEVMAGKGILDLRKCNLWGRSVSLEGEWGFFWKELLTPDSMRPAPVFVSYPMLWDKLKLDGRALPSQGYATYTLTVLLPAERPVIGLDLQVVYCFYGPESFRYAAC